MLNEGRVTRPCTMHVIACAADIERLNAYRRLASLRMPRMVETRGHGCVCCMCMWTCWHPGRPYTPPPPPPAAPAPRTPDQACSPRLSTEPPRACSLRPASRLHFT